MSHPSQEVFNALPEDVRQYIQGIQGSHSSLEGQVKALREVNTALKSHDRAPKLPDPRPYDGARNTRALRDYIYDLKQHFKNEPSKFSNDETKIRFASSFLRGTAKLWFQNLEEAGKAPWKDFDSYHEELSKTFAELDPLQYWQRKWDTLQQRTSVSQYLAEFTLVAAQLDLTEQIKRHHFEKGLKPNIRGQLALLTKPESFDELVKIANQIDARFFEHSRNRMGNPGQQLSTIQHNFVKRYRPNPPSPPAAARPLRWDQDPNMQIDMLQRHQPVNRQGWRSIASQPQRVRPVNMVNTRPANGGRNATQQNGIICWGCGAPGHTARNCLTIKHAASARNSSNQARPAPRSGN